MISGIYIIMNKINGKYYIGSAKDFLERKRLHFTHLSLQTHFNKHLQNAYNKYWSCSFEFLIIEHCELSQLLIREQWWLDITHCWKRHIGYNIRPNASSQLGIKYSEEHKRKLSEIHKGKKQSEETKKKMSEIMKIRRSTKENKLHYSIKMLGNKNSPRNFEKWPCEKGSACKCKECRNRKAMITRQWYANQKQMLLQ